MFSELKSITVQSPYILCGGSAAKSAQFTAEESFDFCCVSNPENLEKILSYYRLTFARYGFDGVFLDRIRYPSFTAGLDAFIGCTCEHCRFVCEKLGFPIAELEDYLKKLKVRIADKSNPNPLGLRGYKDGAWEFEDQQLKRLLLVKSRIVYNALLYLTNELKGEVSEIGLDMFAPFLSAFVGQSYESLQNLADFVKPMLYRFTNTPAGFRFELVKLVEAISEPDTFSMRKAFICRLLNIEGDESMEKLMNSELSFIKRMGGKAVPGIELHTAQGLTPISAKQLSQNIELLRSHSFGGAAACWNILEASEESRRIFLSNGDD